MGDAKFSVNGIAWDDDEPGVDVTDGALLTLLLESTVDVVSVTFEVIKTTKNVSALARTFTPSNGEGGGRPTTPASACTLQLPTAGRRAATYLIRATINGGRDANGRLVDAFTRERAVCTRKAGLRVPLFSEQGQYDAAFGWEPAVEELVNNLNGLEVATKLSGETLEADVLNMLDDDGEASPAFVLPAPSTWEGRKLVAKRLGQVANEASLTAVGGALIDGVASYSLFGTDVCAEFYSDGTRILVGPTTGNVTSTDTRLVKTYRPTGFHLAPWAPSTLGLVSGAVQTAADFNGSFNVMTAPNAGARPLYNVTGPDTQNGHPSISTTYDQGSFAGSLFATVGATTGNVSYSLMTVAKFRSFDPAALQKLISSGYYDAGTTSWGNWIAALGGGLSQSAGGYGRGVTTTQDADLTTHVFVSTYHQPTNTEKFYIDGFLVATATPPVYPAANSVNTRNGWVGLYKDAAGSSLADAARFDCQWPSYCLTDAEVREYSRDAAKSWGLAKVGLIYCNGDSITAGNTLSDVNNAWPFLLQTSNLVNGGVVQVVNAGVGLRTIEQIATLSGIADATTAAFSGQRQFGPQKIGNIEFIWGSTNDNYAGNKSIVEIMDWYEARRNASLATGFVPIVATMLRRAGGTGPQETVRVGVNNELRAAGWRNFDPAEHPAFLSTASVAQTVVGFSDGIHPTDQANIDVLAPMAAEAANAAIAEESPT